MALTVIIGFILVVVATLAWATTQPSAAESASAAAKADSAAPVSRARPEKCESGRRAVPWYRAATWRWQLKRNAERLADRTPIVQGKSCKWVGYAVQEWIGRAAAARSAFGRWAKEVAAQKAKERQHPKWIALRLLGGDRESWNCLLSITWVENRTMDPTLDYGGGHGNVYEAYGIPQATPGTKMASAGPDWRTNPETQLRWMIDYCRARYGSVCGAAYHRRVYGTY